jgi:carbamoyltransferase
MFVQPASGDDGSALGAALYVKHQHQANAHPVKMGMPYWGPEFSRGEIEEALQQRRGHVARRFDQFEELAAHIAQRLAQGQVAAWFQGRMEFGPRALGNRSILADPRQPGMRDHLNQLIKKRENFRPFAPAVAAEDASRYFEIEPGDEDTYAYMLLVTSVRDAYRAQLPATTHVDGSARVQTVSQEDNWRFWTLLKYFEKISGFPILLNTSFNLKEQPIIRTPLEALNTYLSSGIDVLVLGDYVVETTSLDQ